MSRIAAALRRAIVRAAPTCTLWETMECWDALILRPWRWYCDRFDPRGMWRASVARWCIIGRREVLANTDQGPALIADRALADQALTDTANRVVREHLDHLAAKYGRNGETFVEHRLSGAFVVVSGHDPDGIPPGWDPTPVPMSDDFFAPEDWPGVSIKVLNRCRAAYGQPLLPEPPCYGTLYSEDLW